MDIQIRCQDCNEEFPFTAGQQYFYQSRGFTNPKRCPRCKSAKKKLHQNISDGFKNHRVSAVPKNVVILVIQNCIVDGKKGQLVVIVEGLDIQLAWEWLEVSVQIQSKWPANAMH